jgi:hypothetical protein
LSITDRGSKLLIHCHGGCDQRAVIEALRARGLWPERPRQDWTPQQRADWARQQRDISRDLPAARRWQRAAVAQVEHDLELLKAALPDPGPADPEGIWWREQYLLMLRRLDGVSLVREYETWRTRHPILTAAMVHSADVCERAERRALERLWIEMHQQPVPRWVSEIALRWVEARN